MNSTTRTKVSKAHKAIRTLIAMAFPQWKGRTVTIIEAGPGWGHTLYTDDQTKACYYGLKTRGLVWANKPAYGEEPVELAPTEDAILMIHSHFMGKDMGVEIIVRAASVISDVIKVAEDLVLQTRETAIAGAMVNSALNSRTGQVHQWGEYDTGFERVTVLDIIFAALTARVATLEKAHAKVLAA